MSHALLAQVSIALGEHEKALEALEAAYRSKAVDLLWLGVRPSFDPLRRHPAFAALQQRMGLGARA